MLLLIGTNLPAIMKLGHKALIAMGAGTLGILLGGILTFPFFFSQSPDLWKGWGCLAASWNGGSANMIAVKEILSAPEDLFSNLIIVDTFIAYSWMAFLIFISKYQEKIDHFLRSDSSKILDSPETDLNVNDQPVPDDQRTAKERIYNLVLKFAMVLFFLTLSYGLWILSATLPNIGTFINRKTWTIVFATLLPLILSLTPARKIERWGSPQTGIFLLLILLTSIGARADISGLSLAPRLIILGFLWVIIHGMFLLAVGRIFKIPLALLATASQANLGGAVSAPIVASVYNKKWVPAALVIAVLGGIYGTASGMFLAKICLMMSDLL